MMLKVTTSKQNQCIVNLSRDRNISFEIIKKNLNRDMFLNTLIFDTFTIPQSFKILYACKIYNTNKLDLKGKKNDTTLELLSKTKQSSDFTRL